MIVISQSISSNAQVEDSSLLSLLGEEQFDLPKFKEATFKTTRVINIHSIENVYAGVMELRISHRFGALNGGPYTLYGLDQANMKFNFDFGVTRWLSLGVGRSNIEKSYDGFIKIKYARQTTSDRMPVSISSVSGCSISTLKWAVLDRTNFLTSRLSFFHQLLIARKFSESFSLQIIPMIIHRNLISDSNLEENDVLALGLGLRKKISKRTSFNFEYIVTDKNALKEGLRNSISVGFDIETGGHVFQLHLTNSMAMVEKAVVTETADAWYNGGIHFGFNLSRVFTIDSNTK